MSGFTYNGVHCSKYGVEYVPDASARWWKDAEFETYKKDISWRNGGYWYGSSVNIREIPMDCYFEEISTATREKIRKWLGRTTSGDLVIDDKPFVYYKVRPDGVVPGKLYNDMNDTYSGTFSVTFIATDPFGYLTRKSNSGSENDGAEDYCGIIATSMMPDAPTTSSRQFDVYNPGTQNCGLKICVAGTSSNPIRFINERNGTKCVISTLPSNGLILDMNGDTGMVKTYVSGSPNNFSNGCAYHDYGMIRLEADETYTDVSYTAVQNGTNYTVTPVGITVDAGMIGGYIQFNDPATRNARIVAVNTSAGTLTCTLGGSGTFQTSGKMRLSTMNHIVIQEKNSNDGWVTPTSLTLTALTVDYDPRLL